MMEVLATARRDLEAENERLSMSPTISTPASLKDADTTIPSPSRTATKGLDRFKPSIQSFVSELRKSAVDREGFIRLKWIKVAPNDASRVGTFLNELTSGLERYGFAFNGTGSRVGFSKGDTTVDFEIEAPRKRETDVSQSGWKQFTYNHVGRFKLRIYGRAEGVRKEWIDTDSKSLEFHIDNIVESFRVNHIAEIAHNERNRQQEERRVHLARRRQMSEQRVKREEDRLAYLRWIADARREADDLRATISLALPGEEVSGDYQRMIEWARLRLAHLDEQSNIAAVQTALQEKALFAFPDPLHDPEGEPPPKNGLLGLII
jgi:hypothetical protein